MKDNKISVGTKISVITANQLREVLKRNNRTFSGQLTVWTERDYKRITKKEVAK